ncbi:unnamed protein product [Vitrella brassicaformis CCMP3155]|uniref:Uncharacterized protein n=1 Tax=Vitrella brassicaformis (strain CCMP3155) TaxID=1169540 RepID=A0A0G4FJR5_VITBC|nr:unnamed protein product [Vitrella brassicaformis CCMP3155]|eukprot:CEM13940.1 unnamed protein product [Vitrella brassicaformis CCMP3155]
MDVDNLDNLRAGLETAGRAASLVVADVLRELNVNPDGSDKFGDIREALEDSWSEGGNQSLGQLRISSSHKIGSPDGGQSLTPERILQMATKGQELGQWSIDYFQEFSHIMLMGSADGDSWLLLETAQTGAMIGPDRIKRVVKDKKGSELWLLAECIILPFSPVPGHWAVAFLYRPWLMLQYKQRKWMVPSVELPNPFKDTKEGNNIYAQMKRIRRQMTGPDEGASLLSCCDSNSEEYTHAYTRTCTRRDIHAQLAVFVCQDADSAIETSSKFMEMRTKLLERFRLEFELLRGHAREPEQWRLGEDVLTSGLIVSPQQTLPDCGVFVICAIMTVMLLGVRHNVAAIRALLSQFVHPYRVGEHIKKPPKKPKSLPCHWVHNHQIVQNKRKDLALALCMISAWNLLHSAERNESNWNMIKGLLTNHLDDVWQIGAQKKRRTGKQQGAKPHTEGEGEGEGEEER